MTKQKVTEQTFKAVKILINGGAKNKEVCVYLNLSPSTVSRIKGFETFEEYKQTIKASAYMAKKAAEKKEEAKEEKPVEPQVVEHRQTVQLIANHYMAEQLQAQTKLLEIISNKLAYIVEQLQ